MSNSNNKGAKGKKANAAQQRKAMKNEILNELRAAAGVPRKGKGRGAANRRAKAAMSRGASDSDHSQVLGGTGGQSRTYSPRVGVIEKRELITLVSGSVAFTALKFAINPGLAATFPVGSPEAKNWTEWRCKRLMVEYIPTVSEFATQGQSGEVAIGLDYNAENEVPTNMQQIEAMHFAGGGIPSRGFQFEASPRFINKADPKYIRFGAPPVGEDLRLYDGGNLYFATNGCTNATQIGKLEVTYHFEVQLPTLLNQGATTVSPSTAWFQSAAAGETAGLTTVDTPLLAATATANGLGVVNTAGSFVPPAGNYIVDFQVTVATGTSAALTVEADIKKNGVSVFSSATGHPTSGPLGVPALYKLAIDAQALVSANGTDAFTFEYTQTGATATASGTSGSVMWTVV
jgi:hypothetical protein